MRLAKRPVVIAFASVAVIAMLAAGLAAFHIGAAHAAAISPQSVSLTRVGSSSFASAPQGTDSSVQAVETDSAALGDAADGGDGGDGDVGTNRVLPGTTTGNGLPVNPNKRAKSNPELNLSLDGLNFHDQRFANGGNQFSVEPPDQGLCAGNGFVVESVNDVLAVYDTSGHLVKGPTDLNTFYGYAPAINRQVNPLQFGPEVTDPSCLFDPVTGRFFHVALTLDRAAPTTQGLNGKNHLDLAVSDSADPTGTWTIYRLPVQDDGSGGTPNHHCVGGPCLGDYPHIGADRNGIYLTTNEFAFIDGFRASQIYAIGKAALTSGAPTVSASLFDTFGVGPDGRGFTIWPAQTPGMQFSDDQGGTEYLLSSDARFQGGSSTQILLWALTNTSSLNTAAPSPTLSVTTVGGVTRYSPPPKATQKPGDVPLRDCLADTTTPVTATLSGCWRFVVASGGPFTNHEGVLDSNDSRMQQVFYANGKLWGSLDTAISVGGQNRAGVAFFVLTPDVSSGTPVGSLVLQGQVGVAQTDLTYPALAVLPNGRGVMTFTLTGDNDWPSAAYASIDALTGVGDIHVAAAGAGPQDGFSEYVPLSQNSLTVIRPRWGDYGSAAVDGKTIWLASEYVGQTCTFSQYLSSGFTCGNTRSALGNWGTRISNVTP